MLPEKTGRISNQCQQCSKSSSKLGRLAFSESTAAVGNKSKTARAILPTLNTSDWTLCWPSPRTISGAMWWYECQYSSCADADKDIHAFGMEMKHAFPKSIITGLKSFPCFSSKTLFDFKSLWKMCLLWTWLRALMMPLKMRSQCGLSALIFSWPCKELNLVSCPHGTEL